MGNKVIIAGYGQSGELLKSEFPEISFVYLPGFRVRYSWGERQVFKILCQLPLFFYWKFKEHILLNRIIQTVRPDLIISDNRYGIYNSKIESIIVTHQLKLFLPAKLNFLEGFIQQRLKKWITKFDHCWIPDNEGESSLAGKMVQVYPMVDNVKYIGLLSRFYPFVNAKKQLHTCYDIIAIVSGPEPQRTVFLKLLIKYLPKTNYKCLLLTGNPTEGLLERQSGIDLFGHLNVKQLKGVISQAKLVICRSGYSSIMDLIALEKNAILVPTPGQCEQQILADRCYKKNLFHVLEQRLLCELPLLISQIINANKTTYRYNFYPNNFRI